MRVPTDVSDTLNSYLAFRAVLLAGTVTLGELTVAICECITKF